MCAKVESRANTREQERLKVSSLIGTDVFVAGTYVYTAEVAVAVAAEQNSLGLHRPWKPCFASFFHVPTAVGTYPVLTTIGRCQGSLRFFWSLLDVAVGRMLHSRIHWST